MSITWRLSQSKSHSGEPARWWSTCPARVRPQHLKAPFPSCPEVVSRCCHHSVTFQSRGSCSSSCFSWVNLTRRCQRLLEYSDFRYQLRSPGWGTGERVLWIPAWGTFVCLCNVLNQNFSHVAHLHQNHLVCLLKMYILGILNKQELKSLGISPKKLFWFVP